MQWQTVIGLEIHVQLNTKSKLFSPACNRFGNEPNTNISEICSGQPGTLPMLNKEAVYKAIQLGHAIQAKITKKSRFDRKSYFYPDSPRNFQITQFDHPFLKGGFITTEVDGQVAIFAINRAHLEDDAGMIKHFSNFAGIDYNRAGAPLIEIVSEPCMHSSKEAVCYAMALRDILLYLDISDCNMEEGSLRIDVNISVRPEEETTLRNRIEIKNINSFSYMQMAIDKEVERQIQQYRLRPDENPLNVIQRATYRFDTEKKETVMMREKEEADDYRYCPEPDLPPLIVEEALIQKLHETLPELPRVKRQRFLEELNLPHHFVDTLLADRPLCLYFEETLKTSKEAKALCNWLIVEFTGRLKVLGKNMFSSNIPPQHIGELIDMIDKGEITGKIAKAMADVMVQEPHKSPRQIAKENPSFRPLEDTFLIETLVDEIIRNNPQSVADYKSGRDKAFAFLVGQVMKATEGKASPALVNELLKKKIQES